MSEKSHLLLVDQQTFDHLLAGVRALQLLQTLPGSWTPFETIDGEVLNSKQLDTLVENLNTGFFEPQQGEVLRRFHQPELMSFAERAGDYHSINDECEIDDEPIFSEADGVWVNAWVWVPREG